MSCNCQNTSSNSSFLNSNSFNSFKGNSNNCCSISHNSFGFLGFPITTDHSFVATTPSYKINFTLPISRSTGILTTSDHLILAKSGYYRLSASVTLLTIIGDVNNDVIGMFVATDEAGMNKVIDINARSSKTNATTNSAVYTGETIIHATNSVQNYYLFLSIVGTVNVTVKGTWASLMIIPV